MPAEQALFSSESGSGSQTVVFVHGFGADHRAWDAIAAPLAPDARTLAYDLPGHGLSLDAAGAGSAKFAARAILADLSARKISSVHVAGHSMGGTVAALMALAEPERIASLTLLAPGGFGPEINAPLLRRYARAADESELRACLSAMSGKNASVAGPVVRHHLGMRRRPGQIEKLVEIAAAITRDDRQGVIPPDVLKKLAMPATVLWGSDDPVLPFSQSESLPSHFKRLAVPGAGHMLASEAAERTSAAIRAQLAASAAAI